MKLILDYSRWRCGLYGNHKLGRGNTQLKNPEGFYCCLGLFTPQLTPSVTEEDILEMATPEGISHKIEKEVPELTERNEEFEWRNTKLAVRAISINDNEETTPEEKIEALKELFAEAGHEIEVINLPVQ